MKLTLGAEPARLTVALVEGGSFWTTLTLVDDGGTAQPFDIHDSVELHIDRTVWSATITGNLAVFDVAPADVQAVIDDTPKIASLWLVSGAHRVPWGVGTVKVTDA